MKMIDLLNRIAIGEDIPTNFKCDGYVWKYKETMKDWYSYENKCFIFSEYFKEDLKCCLHYEVETLEDKPKKIEKLDLYEVNGVGDEDDAYYLRVNGKEHYLDSEYDSQEVTTILKINEIIDKLNYLLEKSDKE